MLYANTLILMCAVDYSRWVLDLLTAPGEFKITILFEPWRFDQASLDPVTMLWPFF